MKIDDRGFVCIEQGDICLNSAGISGNRIRHAHLTPLCESLAEALAAPDITVNDSEFILRPGVTTDRERVEAGICQCGQGFYRYLLTYAMGAGDGG